MTTKVIEQVCFIIYTSLLGWTLHQCLHLKLIILQKFEMITKVIEQICFIVYTSLKNRQWKAKTMDIIRDTMKHNLKKIYIIPIKTPQVL